MKVLRRARTQVERASERELVIRRVFRARPQTVFDAMTKPELLRRWWAPRSLGVVAVRVRVRSSRRRALPLRLRAPGRAADGFLRHLQGSRTRRSAGLHADLRAHAPRRRRRDHRNVRGARRRNTARRSASSIRRRKCSMAQSRRGWSVECARRWSNWRRCCRSSRIEASGHHGARAATRASV